MRQSRSLSLSRPGERLPYPGHMETNTPADSGLLLPDGAPWFPPAHLVRRHDGVNTQEFSSLWILHNALFRPHRRGEALLPAMEFFYPFDIIRIMYCFNSRLESAFRSM